MDELQISGKRFISSRRIARENGYTSDYIGQLIRGGKIVGQKVGRAWYVEAASFQTYLGEESSAPVAISEPAVETTPVREEVEPTLEKHEELLPDPTPEAITAAIEEKKEEAELAVELELPEVSESEISEKELLSNTLEEPVAASVVEEETEDSQQVPLRIVAQTPAAEAGGLRYYAEEAPTLPVIRENKTTSRIGGASELSGASVHPIEKSKSKQKSARTGRGAWVALAATGAMIFVFSAVVSSALSLNMSIQEGNSAASYYSLDW